LDCDSCRGGSQCPGWLPTPGADESGTTMPRTRGLPDERAVVAGAGISRRGKALSRGNRCQPSASPVRLRGVCSGNCLCWRSWWHNGCVFGKVVVTIRVLLENSRTSGLRGVPGRAFGPDLAFMTRLWRGAYGVRGRPRAPSACKPARPWPSGPRLVRIPPRVRVPSERPSARGAVPGQASPGPH
jgi:hypothetical protein